MYRAYSMAPYRRYVCVCVQKRVMGPPCISHAMFRDRRARFYRLGFELMFRAQGGGFRVWG